MFPQNEIIFSKGKINVNLTLFFFKEGEIYICYCPALDLSDSGETEEEALEMLKENLKIFFDYTTKKKTLNSELKRLGWKKDTKKRCISPEIEEIKNQNPLFENLVISKSQNINQGVYV